MTGTLTTEFTLSILVPVYNEIVVLPFFVEHIQQQMSKKHELIFIDGESTDGTWEWLKKQKSLKAFQTEKGRARQLNLGAEKATHDVLYFVHVDTLLPKGFDQLIQQALQKGAQTGCFQLQFSPSNFWLRLAGRGSRWNHILCRGGDQTLFVTKPLFTKVGGFDKGYTVCEDINFIQKLYQHTTFHVLPHHVTTSARRFIDNGSVWVLFHFGILHLLHWMGFSPTLLQRYYTFTIR